MLEAAAEPGGAWPHCYGGLTLFSLARFSALPGRLFGGGPDRCSHCDEVVASLGDCAADLRCRRRVVWVEVDGKVWR